MDIYQYNNIALSNDNNNSTVNITVLMLSTL